MKKWEKVYSYLIFSLFFLFIIISVYLMISNYAKDRTLNKLTIKNNLFRNIEKDDSKDIQFIDDLIIIRKKHLSIKQFNNIIFDDINHTIGFDVNKIIFIKKFNNDYEYKQRKNKIYKFAKVEYDNLLVLLCGNVISYIFLLIWMSLI